MSILLRLVLIKTLTWFMKIQCFTGQFSKRTYLTIILNCIHIHQKKITHLSISFSLPSVFAGATGFTFSADGVAFYDKDLHPLRKSPKMQITGCFGAATFAERSFGPSKSSN